MIIKTFTEKEIRENRNLWIDALEFGNYEQGEGYLKNGSKYCCLGVACEVLKERLGLEVPLNEEFGPGVTQFEDSIASLSSAMLIALGLSEEHQAVLIALNDNGASFKSIAAALQEMRIHYPEESLL